MTEASILSAVERLTRAPDRAALLAQLRHCPELLAPQTDTWITAAIQTEDLETIEDQQMEANCAWLAARGFLAACRGMGVEQAAALARLPLAETCPLRRLIQLADEEKAPRERAALAGEALRLLRRETEENWWAEVQYLQAQAVFEARSEPRAARLKEAAASAQAALDTWYRKQYIDLWEETLHLLDQIWEAYAGLDRRANTADALAFYESHKAQALRQRRPLEVARLLHSIASLECQESGPLRPARVDDAIGHYQEALHIIDEAEARCPDGLEQCRRQRAVTQTCLGNAYLVRLKGETIENTQQALRYFRQARQVFNGPQFEQRYAEVEYGLAVACRMRSTQPVADQAGETPPKPWLEQALAHAHQAEAVYASTERGYHWARTQNLLATLYGQSQDETGHQRTTALRQAIQHAQAAVDAFDPASHPLEWSMALNNLGNMYADLPPGKRGETRRNLRRAILCYRRSLRVRTEEAYPAYYAETHNNLGTVFNDLFFKGLDLTGLLRAAWHLNAALAIRQPEVMPLGARQSAINLGNTWFQVGLWKQALDAYQIALRASQTAYQASVTQIGKKAELSQNAMLYQRAAYAAAMSGQTDEALVILEQGKTRLLTEMLMTSVRKPPGVDETVWQRYTQAAQARVGARSSQEENDQFQQFGGAGAQLAASEAELQAAIAEVRRQAHGFLPDVRRDELPTCLPDEHTALVAFCITEAGGLALVYSAARPRVQRIKLPGVTTRWLDQLLYGQKGNSQPEGWVTGYLRGLTGELDKVWSQVMNDILSKVSQQLLQPVINSLDNQVEKIIFLPGGGLYLLPLHAAPLPKEAGCVSDRYQVRYAPSLKIMQMNRREPQGSSDVCALINPRARPAGARGVFREHLPLARAMAYSLKQVNPSSEIYTGIKCTKAQLSDLAPRARQLHFFTHGKYDWRQPYQSQIMLAGGESLTLEDLYRGVVDLSATRLVTLTACETGIPETKVLPEEYIGLPAGFMQAGVSCVVSALWSVPVGATMLLMHYFYQAYSPQQDAAAALNAAQDRLRSITTRDLLKEPLIKDSGLYRSDAEVKAWIDEITARHSLDERPYQHPFYWAAFTVSGL